MSEVVIREGRILENTLVAADTWLLRFHGPDLVVNARAGQFVMVKVGTSSGGGYGPLLRRPFSIHRLGDAGDVSLLYRVVGQGTDLMSRMRIGQSLEVVGPLGRGFDLTGDLSRGAYLVGGGIGVAPLVELAVQMGRGTEVTLFYGERFGRLVVPDQCLEAAGGDRVIVTEDGLQGVPGLVTGPLAEALARKPAPVFACGPRPMLMEVARLAERAGVPAQVSLEAHMACGLGACLGCVTEIKAKTLAPAYARVCLEGPVFRAEEIKW